MKKRVISDLKMGITLFTSIKEPVSFCIFFLVDICQKSFDTGLNFLCFSLGPRDLNITGYHYFRLLMLSKALSWNIR